MLRTRIIPTLLLKDGGLVKTVKFKNDQYVGDPINAVRIFNEKAVDEIILLDVDAGDGPDFDLIADIVSEAFIPLCYGGGVSNLQQIEKLFNVGIEKVSINSAAAGDLSLISDAAQRFGSQSVVVGIDYRKTLFGSFERVIGAGRVKTKESPIDFAKRAQAAGAGELLLYSVDRDGTMQGYDNRLIAEVADALSIPVIACGGAGSLTDMAEVITKFGASSAAAGSFFVFQGKHRAVLISYPNEEDISSALNKVSWS